MKAVTVATFHEVGPAHQLEKHLEAEGLPATIHDESKLERFWFMSEPFAAIHVEVDQRDYLEARRIFEKWTEVAWAVHCPECRSSRVEFPQVSRKFVTPGLTSVLMVFHIVPREFYCLDCHHTWPKQTPIERERDLLGWPADSKMWHPGKPRQNKQAS